MSHLYAKFKENASVGTDVSTPLFKLPSIFKIEVRYFEVLLYVLFHWIIKIDFTYSGCFLGFSGEFSLVFGGDKHDKWWPPGACERNEITH